MVDDAATDPNEKTRQAALERVLGFARLLESLSRRFLGTARTVTLLGIAAAILLDLLLHRAFEWSTGVTVLVGLLFLVPAGVVGWGWYVLSEAASLPGRLMAWLGSAKATTGAFVQRARSPERPGRLTDLWSLGTLAVDLASMGLDASGLMAILGGTLSVTNPIYLLALAVSIGLIGLWGGLVLILGLMALF